MRLLVVEDDPRIEVLLRRGLIMEGHEVELASTGRQGLERAESEEFDALVLDLTLPDMDGLEVARRLREGGVGVPILMLTGRQDLEDRLRGFAAGADDYLVKPFALPELIARLRALVRRTTGASQEDRLVVAGLVMDRRAHEVRRDGRLLELTPREYGVLEALMQRPGQVLSKEMLLEHVWGYSSDAVSNVVEATIRRLRQEVDAGYDRPLIQTVRGAGYKLQA